MVTSVVVVRSHSMHHYGYNVLLINYVNWSHGSLQVCISASVVRTCILTFMGVFADRHMHRPYVWFGSTWHFMLYKLGFINYNLIKLTYDITEATRHECPLACARTETQPAVYHAMRVLVLTCEQGRVRTQAMSMAPLCVCSFWQFCCCAVSFCVASYVSFYCFGAL